MKSSDFANMVMEKVLLEYDPATRERRARFAQKAREDREKIALKSRDFDAADRESSKVFKHYGRRITARQQQGKPLRLSDR